MRPAICVLLLLPAASFGGELTPAERGRLALTGKSFNPAVWSKEAYQNAWKQWPAKLAAAPGCFGCCAGRSRAWSWG